MLLNLQIRKSAAVYVENDDRDLESRGIDDIEAGYKIQKFILSEYEVTHVSV